MLTYFTDVSRSFGPILGPLAIRRIRFPRSASVCSSGIGGDNTDIKSKAAGWIVRCLTLFIKIKGLSFNLYIERVRIRTSAYSASDGRVHRQDGRLILHVLKKAKAIMTLHFLDSFPLCRQAKKYGAFYELKGRPKSFRSVFAPTLRRELCQTL